MTMTHTAANKNNHNDENPEMTYKEVPTLSLKDYTDGDSFAREKFIKELFNGLKYYGFIILKDHPVQVNLIEEAYSNSKALFNLPLETKKSYISKTHGNQRGYTPFGKEHAKNSPVHDLKEFWHVGRELSAGHKYSEIFPDNIWPKELAHFRMTMQNLYSSLDHVGRIMLEALTPSLAVPQDYFDKMIHDGNGILRLLHYPPLEAGVDTRCVRAAAHEDINLITILVAATTSGLELLDRDGKWLAIETEKNNLIVDAGDMLARITNDRIPSTTHRVVNPKDGTNDHRYSMPYFIHPNPEAVLSCIDSCKGDGAKYPDILAQEFLMQRLREIGLIADKPSGK
jgi:isopenicillin N synthase-like dioxygenase